MTKQDDLVEGLQREGWEIVGESLESVLLRLDMDEYIVVNCWGEVEHFYQPGSENEDENSADESGP